MTCASLCISVCLIVSFRRGRTAEEGINEEPACEAAWSETTSVDNSDVSKRPSPQSPPPPPPIHPSASLPAEVRGQWSSPGALLPPESTCEEDSLSVWGSSSAGPPAISQQLS